MHDSLMNTTFCVRTFGCQMNKHDSERIAGMLEEFRDGYERNLQKKGERA